MFSKLADICRDSLLYVLFQAVASVVESLATSLVNARVRTLMVASVAVVEAEEDMAAVDANAISAEAPDTLPVNALRVVAALEPADPEEGARSAMAAERYIQVAIFLQPEL